MNNPRVFPVSGLFREEEMMGRQSGITLLDHFAGMAIQGLTARPQQAYGVTARHLSQQAYQIARAMLVERENYADLTGEPVQARKEFEVAEDAPHIVGDGGW